MSYNKEDELAVMEVIRQQVRRKYEGAGIYSISIQGKIVYIGKSTDMEKRIAAHINHIEKQDEGYKYVLLAAITEPIVFNVLERCEEEQLGQREAFWINQYVPILNYQIPSLVDYRKYRINKRAKMSIEQFKEYIYEGH